MYRLLIIDDECSKRAAKYQKILSDNFLIDVVLNDEDVLGTKLCIYYDAILLDHNLNNTHMDLSAVLDKCADHGAPIIIISEYKDVVTLKNMNKGKPQVEELISLKPIFSALEATELDSELKYIFNTLYNDLKSEFCTRIINVIEKTASCKPESQSANILHFSDLHFGKEDHGDSEISNFLSGLKSFIGHEKINISTVVISGDLSYSGKVEEYGALKRHLREFFRDISISPKEQVIIVPGNHDYNCNLAVLDICSETILADKKKFNDSKTFTPLDFTKFSPTAVPRAHFSDSCYQLTENVDYLKHSFFLKNSSCRNLDLEILGIENAAHFEMKTQNKRYIFKENEEKVSLTNGLNSILVGHASPNALGYRDCCDDPDDKEQCNENKCSKSSMCKHFSKMQTLMTRLRSILYLYGHNHYGRYEITPDKRHLFLGTGAPLGKDGVSGGFSILSLEISDENNKKELKVDNQPYLWKDGKETRNKPQGFKYDYQNGEWEKITTA